MKSRCLSTLLAVGAPLALASPALHAELVPPCTLQLQVQFSPEVPNARAPGFLSSLSGDPAYQLTWVKALKDPMAVVLELTGPGPDYRCANEVQRIARDARVINVRVLGHAAPARG